MGKLTDKQRMFILEYPKDFNATQAAIRAGYSVKTARKIGSENLTKPDIRDGIEEYFKQHAMGSEEVLHRLAEIARSSIEDFIDFDGKGYQINFKKASEEGKLKIVKVIRPTREGLVVELEDRIKALELIGKNLKLFTDKVEHDISDDSPLQHFLSTMVGKTYGENDSGRDSEHK